MGKDKICVFECYYSCRYIYHSDLNTTQVPVTILIAYSMYSDISNRVRLLINSYKLKQPGVDNVRIDVRMYKAKTKSFKSVIDYLHIEDDIHIYTNKLGN